LHADNRGSKFRYNIKGNLGGKKIEGKGGTDDFHGSGGKKIKYAFLLTWNEERLCPSNICRRL